MSVHGTFETSRNVRFTAALGGRADMDQVVLPYVPFNSARYRPPRAGAQTFADSGSACREGGGRTRKSYRPSFVTIRDRARYRQGRFQRRLWRLPSANLDLRCARRTFGH
jgi:hypothetical protein